MSLPRKLLHLSKSLPQRSCRPPIVSKIPERHPPNASCRGAHELSKSPQPSCRPPCASCRGAHSLPNNLYVFSYVATPNCSLRVLNQPPWLRVEGLRSRGGPGSYREATQMLNRPQEIPFEVRRLKETAGAQVDIFCGGCTGELYSRSCCEGAAR